MYDFTKIMIFNLLYSGGKDDDKTNFLFKLCENVNSGCVHNHSPQLYTIVEYLVTIPCVIVAEVISSTNKKFQSDNDEQEFRDLFSLYTTNTSMIKEFAK
jgi:hypothetical protein